MTSTLTAQAGAGQTPVAGSREPREIQPFGRLRAVPTGLP